LPLFNVLAHSRGFFKSPHPSASSLHLSALPFTF
jgi:hypothetical protein